ncbi:MAG: hypothetical protein ACOY4F_07320 [Thermodesulfobacteriota bacterium]
MRSFLRNRIGDFFLRTRGGRTAVPPKPLDLVVKTFGRGPGKPVLFLGDSSVERIAREDADRRTTAEMLDARLGGVVLGATHSAYHPTIYRHLLALFERLPARPRLVVVAVNLRCFSPIWEFRPEFQFRSEIGRIDEYARRGRLRPHRGDAPRDEAAWNRFLAHDLGLAESDLTRVGDYIRLTESRPADPDGQTRRRRGLFMAHYLPPLAPDNRRLADLARTVERLLPLGINILLYLTPVNMMAGIRHVGEHFALGVKRNADRVLQAVHDATSGRAPARCVPLDLSRALDATFFFHREDTTEHLNQHGRAALAGILEKHIGSHGLLSDHPGHETDIP